MTTSFSVTASGFKPETFSSVVRCSIQLSYAAGYFRVANIAEKSVLPKIETPKMKKIRDCFF